MSLLNIQYDEKVNKLARQIYEKQLELDPRLNQAYDERQKKMLFEDTLHNLSYLKIAMEFGSEEIFTSYAIWLYQLLSHLLRDVPRESLAEQLVMHYNLMETVLNTQLSDIEMDRASQYLKSAIRVTINEVENPKPERQFLTGKHTQLKQDVLEKLLIHDSEAVRERLKQAIAAGTPLDEIYVDVLQNVMYEVGSLWHKHTITVDVEHYCTATVQAILAEFYPIIFATPRKGMTVLACSVGSELHELGVRMVSDVFEYHGWDSIYLGAAVPPDAIVHSIEENKPDLVVLSVTMPHHLHLCYEAVQTIRKVFPSQALAVGGGAFAYARDIWKTWNVDISTENAVQLVEWAQAHIVNVKGR